MEYIYGTMTRNGSITECLKTVGNEHTDLRDFIMTVRRYPDQEITDSCRIVCKYRSEEDSEGNCYDWYEIDKHDRYIDKTGPIKEVQVDTDGLLVDFEYRLTLLELGVMPEV